MYRSIVLITLFFLLATCGVIPEEGTIVYEQSHPKDPILIPTPNGGSIFNPPSPLQYIQQI